MAHQLAYIHYDHLLKGLDFIDNNGVPKDNEWNEYWIFHNNKLYPFKYSVEKASEFTAHPIKTTDFTSNESSRKYIASLGVAIQYKAQISNMLANPNFWIGATYYGIAPEQQDMYADFYANGYWRTDHDLSSGTGLRLYNLLKKVKVNDRLALRYFSRKKRTAEIFAIGTVKDISEISNGKLRIVWDYNPKFYKGTVPEGQGSGNWSTTFFQLTRPEDIYLIFNTGPTAKRLARLTWNDNGFISPSGLIGKSKDNKTHEGQYGYGHEEWLFDTSKQYNGYHYGFLEPIRKHQDAYIGKTYDVWLYTINADTGIRYWVGEIKQIEVLNSSQAAEIKGIYESNGWLKEMEDQIKTSGANAKGFSGYPGLDLFNVRYLPQNLNVNDPYFELPADHPITAVTRYSLSFMKDKFKVNEPDESAPFVFIPPDDIDSATPGKKPKKKTTVRAPKAVEIVYLHKAISENLTVKLRSIYGSKNVTAEHSAGYGQNRIDIVVKNGKELIFYEIKTYNSLTTSIREALGQLLEYAYWPNKNKAKKMVIVTQTPISAKGRLYFKHLRETLNIPIYYQSYNLSENTLSVED